MIKYKVDLELMEEGQTYTCEYTAEDLASFKTYLFDLAESGIMVDNLDGTGYMIRPCDIYKITYSAMETIPL